MVVVCFLLISDSQPAGYIYRQHQGQPPFCRIGKRTFHNMQLFKQQTLPSTYCILSTVRAVNMASKSPLLRSLHSSGEADNKHTNVNKIKELISDSDML